MYGKVGLGVVLTSARDSRCTAAAAATALTWVCCCDFEGGICAHTNTVPVPATSGPDHAAPNCAAEPSLRENDGAGGAAVGLLSCAR